MLEMAELVKLQRDLQQHSYVVVPDFLSDRELAALRQVHVLGDPIVLPTYIFIAYVGMQECETLIEHAFDQELQAGNLSHGWECTLRCVAAICCCGLCLSLVLLPVLHKGTYI